MGNRIVITETNHDLLLEDGLMAAVRKTEVLLAENRKTDIGWGNFQCLPQHSITFKTVTLPPTYRDVEAPYQGASQ